MKVNHALCLSKSRGKHTIRYQKDWLTKFRKRSFYWLVFVLTSTTRQQLAKVNINCIRVGSTDVCPVKVAGNLGSWFDEKLTMSTHISKFCGVPFYHLHNIKRIRKYLSRESTGMLVHMHLLHFVLIYKEPGLDIPFKSFCSVSNLCYISKLSERAQGWAVYVASDCQQFTFSSSIGT